MKPNREQLIESFNNDEYEEIDRTKHHRHNYEFVDIVIPFDGSFYQTSYVQTANDGIDYSQSFNECEEVKLVEVIVKEWHRV